MNNKMTSLLYCEFYKINRKRTLLKLAIAIIVIALAMTALSAVLKDVFSDVYISQGLSEYDAQINSLKEEMQTVKAASGSSWIDKLIVTNSMAGYKARIAVLEYLKAHSVPSGSTMMYSANNSLGLFSFDVFSFTDF